VQKRNYKRTVGKERFVGGRIWHEFDHVFDIFPADPIHRLVALGFLALLFHLSHLPVCLVVKQIGIDPQPKELGPACEWNKALKHTLVKIPRYIVLGS